MNKKVLSLVLSLVMVLGTFTTVFAAEKTNDKEKVEKVVGKDNKIQYIIDRKFVEGYGNGDFGYDKNIKRSEITKLLVYANGNKELAEKLQGAMKLYTDVETSFWANGVITVGSTVPAEANGQAMLNGYPDRSFKPENNVSYAELSKMLVVLVKTDLTADMVKDANNHWASQWLTWAAQLGILDDVTVANSNAPVTRADAFVMVYNALYSMKYFNQVPANETMGILSQLKNNELTINQGEKAKKFKLTANTVYVLHHYYGAKYEPTDVNAEELADIMNIVENKAVVVRAIDNPQYYYGSLIRVLTNDKNEVTHVLELGNPSDLALGSNKRNKNVDNDNNNNIVIDPNVRWQGVADATVETKFYAPMDHQTASMDKRVAAKINYKDGEAKSIDFVKGTFNIYAQNKTDREQDLNNFEEMNYSDTNAKQIVKRLRLTKSTRYFVADVNKNQLTEVNGVSEAIQVLGLTRASNWFFDVYAGYDNYDGYDKVETSKYAALNGFNEAKVVVFNSVQKDNENSQLLRVRTQENTNYTMRLEDTKGNTVVEDLYNVRDRFPFFTGYFNGKDKTSANFDVVNVTFNNAYGKQVETKIDSSATGTFPIVKVLDADGRSIVVEGFEGARARLILDTDYDQFIESDKLVGSYIQFHTLTNNEKTNDVNATNTVDIISVLPYNELNHWTHKGNLLKVVEANEKAQRSGKVATIDFTRIGSRDYQVIVHQDYDLFDAGQVYHTMNYVINETEYNALVACLAKDGHTTEATRDEIRFKVRDGIYKTDEMYDVEVFDKTDNTWKLVRTMQNKVMKHISLDDLKVLITDVNKAYPEVTEGNLEGAKKALAEIDNAKERLLIGDLSTYKSSDDYNVYRTAVFSLRNGIKQLEDSKKAEAFKDGSYSKLEIAGKTFDKVMESDIQGLTSQDAVNVAAGVYNKVAEAYNELGNDVKAKLTAEKTQIDNVKTWIETRDGASESDGNISVPALTEAK